MKNVLLKHLLLCAFVANVSADSTLKPIRLEIGTYMAIGGKSGSYKLVQQTAGASQPAKQDGDGEGDSRKKREPAEQSSIDARSDDWIERPVPLFTLPAIGLIGSIFTDFGFPVQVGWIGMFEGGLSPNLKGADLVFFYGYTGAGVRFKVANKWACSLTIGYGYYKSRTSEVVSTYNFVPSGLGGMATVEYDLNDHTAIQGGVRVLLREKKVQLPRLCSVGSAVAFAGVKFRLL